jgi:hypothetical protein
MHCQQVDGRQTGTHITPRRSMLLTNRLMQTPWSTIHRTRVRQELAGVFQSGEPADESIGRSKRRVCRPNFRRTVWKSVALVGHDYGRNSSHCKTMSDTGGLWPSRVDGVGREELFPMVVSPSQCSVVEIQNKHRSGSRSDVESVPEIFTIIVAPLVKHEAGVVFTTVYTRLALLRRLCTRKRQEIDSVRSPYPAGAYRSTTQNWAGVLHVDSVPGSTYIGSFSFYFFEFETR